jgi:hypothetical protein
MHGSGVAVDISIIIPHRGPEMGLWATIASCTEDLKHSGLTYEFCVLSNGAKESYELSTIRTQLTHLRTWVQSDEAVASVTARQRLTEQATGEFAFILDNHSIVGRDYFKKAVEAMRSGIDFLHGSYNYHVDSEPYYEYILEPYRQFYGFEAYRKPLKSVPYRVASSGHGSFMFRLSAWREMGGYCPILNSMGGSSELCTDLTLWRLGKEVWMHPGIHHSHWGGERGYKRWDTPEWYLSMAMTGYILGGDKLLTSWLDQMLGRPSCPAIPDLRVKAIEESRGYAKWLNEHAIRSFDGMLEYFDKNWIRH